MFLTWSWAQNLHSLKHPLLMLLHGSLKRLCQPWNSTCPSVPGCHGQGQPRAPKFSPVLPPPTYLERIYICFSLSLVFNLISSCSLEREGWTMWERFKLGHSLLTEFLQNTRNEVPNGHQTEVPPHPAPEWQESCLLESSSAATGTLNMA